MALLNPTNPLNRARSALPGILLLAFVFIAYYPALHGGFIWDDDMYVTNNPLLTASDGWRRIWFSQHFQSQYFPLVYTTLRLEHALWGFNSFGYHVVNVLLHGVNALLVWALLRRLSLPGAWLAAAIFALHPVEVESVAWVTELKNTESTLFFLLALLSWLRFTRPGAAPEWWRYALALIFYALALFAKTTACTLPAALVLVLWLRREPIDRRRIFQIAPFVGLGLAMGLLSIWWEGHLGNYAPELGLSFNPVERLLISSRALWFYAVKLLWPANLAFSYPRWQINDHHPLQYGWLAAGVALAILLWQRRKTWGRGAVVAVVFFIATLSPMLGFISEYTFRFSFVADHYQYLASIGLIALFAGWAARAAAAWRLNQILQSVLTAALLLTLGVLTWRQAGVYKNLETLWRDTIAKNPNSWMAHYNLGLWLSQAGRSEPAIDEYRAAARLNPRHAKARLNLGLELAKMGRTNEAIHAYSEALEIEPNFALAQFDLGTTLATQGRLSDAIEHLRVAVRLNPQHAKAWENLVFALAQSGRKDEAFQTLRQEVEAEPDNLNALYNLAQAYASQNQLDSAINTYQRALKVSPDNVALLNNLGNALFTKGRQDEAIEVLRQAARRDPDNPGVHFNLAMMLLQKGNRTAARNELTEALRINPNFEAARKQLNALDAPAPAAVPSK